jgi:deoxyribodipyrimidine photo-lyase
MRYNNPIMTQKTYAKALVIFRRDLRLTDNSTLAVASRLAQAVVPCFIFDPRQVSTQNSYRSAHCLQFMFESLTDLNNQLEKHHSKLRPFFGEPHDVVQSMIMHDGVDAVFVCRDYTPFSQERDTKIEAVCNKHKVHFEAVADLLLHEPEDVLKSDRKPYTIFTPFFNKASGLHLRPKASHAIPAKTFFQGPLSAHSSHFAPKHLATFNDIADSMLPVLNPLNFAKGGRSACQSILRNLGSHEDYQRERDIPALEKTTGLSAHLKFGTCSIREVHAAIVSVLGEAHPLLRQLYWRDFFTHIAFHFPHVFGHAFHERYNQIPWRNSPRLFEAWCEGRTGFPLVDAGMRQLNSTGFMHNRVRMVAASVLVKDLHVDWRWGEKYFASQLIDYDPAVNNGNWQWAASTGCDAQPYFRIFNPWLQQKKFDPDCLYIKRWVPELKSVDAAQIHGLHLPKQHALPPKGYPVALVDHKTAAIWAREMFAKRAHAALK